MKTTSSPIPCRRRSAILSVATALLAVPFASCTDVVGPGSDDGDDDLNVDTPDVSAIVYSVSDAMAENKADHDDAADHVWDAASAIPIALDGSSIVADADGVEIEGSTVTITAPGSYTLSGTLDDGSVVVDSDDDGIVRLVLDGVDITNGSGAPIAVMGADKAMIVLADGSVNRLEDAADYVFPDPEDDEPNAALFSKDDLTIDGSGSLTVEAHYNDGIASKDGLVITGGDITVSAADDGIRGKDYLVVYGGKLTISAGGDGLKSDNDDDADRGYIWIVDGSLDVTAGADGLQAETDLLVSDGDFDIVTADGSTHTISDDDSAKGLKAGVRFVVDGGTFAIDAADDAVHANAHGVINAGTLDLASGDDAVHADSTVGVNGGAITVTRSYEGIEGIGVVIAGGDIWITSSDDGLNGAGDDADFGSGFGQGGDNYLHILGGDITVYAAGDGIDVNGSIVMTDGRVVIHGPTRQDNSAIDYDRSFQLTGGFLVGAGSAGMAQAPDASSGQYVLLLTSNQTKSAGTMVHIETSDGESILSFVPSKQFGSVAFSSPDLHKGTTYRVYLGGSQSGAATDGLYASGSYTAGSQTTEFTISNVVTRVGF